MYWLRKRVPDDLRGVIGKREEKCSLKTKSASEAKVRLAKALTDLEEKWANIRRGPVALSEADAHELAASVYDRWIELHAANPSEQRVWNTEIGVSGVWDPPPPVHLIPLHLMQAYERAEGLQQRCFETADDLLSTAGLTTDETGRRRLARAVSAAMQRASLVLERLALGEGLRADASLRQPAIFHRTSQPVQAQVVSLDRIVDDWAKERGPTKKTLYEWRRVIQELKRYLGHEDAARIASSDLNGWKARLLSEGLRPKTIRDAKIAPVRAILQWGVDNDRLPSNPAARVTIDVRVKATERKRSFTDDEATLVLASARKQVNPVLRWVPWLGAYTGARAAELCQLRREDVLEIDGIWCLRITPEAGPLKTLSSERVVPVHSALIAEGFIGFAHGVSAGPIFEALSPDKFGSRGGNGTKMVGRWVRSLGISDARVSPNHSWRHRMKTLARSHEVRPDIGDALVGHGKRSVGDAYGEFQITALKRELEKIPMLEVK